MPKVPKVLKPHWLKRAKTYFFLTPMSFERISALEKETGFKRHVIVDALIRSYNQKDAVSRVQKTLASDVEALCAWRNQY